jgi:hypothetical protein
VPAPGPDKELCNAQRPKQPEGVLCKQPAGHGTKHLGVGRCSKHGGNTESHEKAAETELARRECQTLGVLIDIDPAEALLHEVREAHGMCEMYRGEIDKLGLHPEDDEFIPGEDGEGHWERGKGGLYGRTYHVSGVPTGEAKPHVLVILWMEERKRRQAAAEAALRAGIAERQVRVAEKQAELFVDAMRHLVGALGHSASDPKVREAMRGSLTLIAGGQTA